MGEDGSRRKRRGAVALTELVGKVIDPVIAARGFASGDLVAAWPEIAGKAYAGWTEPERIAWPRGEANAERAGILHLKVDGPRAIFVQHELPQILERVNAFLGYAAIGTIRIVQRPVTARRRIRPADARPLTPAAETALTAELGLVGDDRLRAALERLGRQVLAGRDKHS